MMTRRIHVIGASGRSGVALVRALLADAIDVVPLVRDPAKWARVAPPVAPRRADLADAPVLTAALADAATIVSCAHARHAAAILDAAPPHARFIVLGSTRRFSRFPDDHGAGVIAGETAFLGSGRSGVILHPTMIYGAQGEDNVRRLTRLLRRLPLSPLPGGGKNLVQPIFQDDVTRAIRAAIDVAWRGPERLVIAGPSPVSYATFVRSVAHAAGLAPPRIVPFPAWMAMAAASLTPVLPGVPTIRPAEIRRLLEDKAFDITDMVQRLGVTPLGLDEGLARMFQRDAATTRCSA